MGKIGQSRFFPNRRRGCLTLRRTRIHQHHPDQGLALRRTRSSNGVSARFDRDLTQPSELATSVMGIETRFANAIPPKTAGPASRPLRERPSSLSNTCHRCECSYSASLLMICEYQSAQRRPCTPGYPGQHVGHEAGVPTFPVPSCDNIDGRVPVTVVRVGLRLPPIRIAKG